MVMRAGSSISPNDKSDSIRADGESEQDSDVGGRGNMSGSIMPGSAAHTAITGSATNEFDFKCGTSAQSIHLVGSSLLFLSLSLSLFLFLYLPLPDITTTTATTATATTTSYPPFLLSLRLLLLLPTVRRPHRGTLPLVRL